MIFRLQRPLKFFLELKSICLRYLEGAPRSGLSNAPTPVAIRCIDQKKFADFRFLWKKNTLRYLFESHFSNYQQTKKLKSSRRKSKTAWKRRIKRKQQSGRHSFDSNAFTRTSQRGLLVHSHTFLSSMKAHKLISRIVWIFTRMFLRHILRKRASRSIRSLKILQKHFDA